MNVTAAEVLVEDLYSKALQGVVELWALLRPGGKWHPASFIERNGHLVVEGLLILVISYLLIQRSYKPSKQRGSVLTEEEVDELCAEWEPEPIAKPLTEAQKQYKPPVISSACGVYVVANGKKVLNMVSLNFLGIAGNPKVAEQCRTTINKYGVGSCGPRGFYGTIDVHLQLENRLARFMGTQESIIYSYDLATVPSIIPAFATAKDLVVADEGCGWAIQNGCGLSRAKLLRFEHNNVADLERVLDAVVLEDAKVRKPLNRRFIVVEGVYGHTGRLAPLAAIVALAKRYRYRLIVDESHALGVLGKTGHGACEHWGLQPGDAQIVSASLGNALGSVGGFCAGSREIVDHQRLSGLGYCFSASLPPYLATAALGALDELEERGEELTARIQRNAKFLRGLLGAVPGLTLLDDEGSGISPLVHLALRRDVPQAFESDDKVMLQLQAAADEALKRDGVLVAVNRKSPLDWVRARPTLRLVVTAAHEEKDLQKAAAAVVAAAKRVFSKPSSSAS